MRWFAIAFVALGLACESHTALECTPTIPCAPGLVCGPAGRCVVPLPVDAAPDAAQPVDAPLPQIDAGPVVDSAPDARVPCSHGECEVGPALESTCTKCTAVVCGFDPFCCDTLWDQACVDIAANQCGCP